MPKRKHYPKEIELKVPNDPESFGTEGRYAAAQVLLKHWDPDEYRIKDYPKLAEQEGYEARSRTFYMDVWKDYFGPQDDLGWTFREIFDEFEDYDEYLRYRDIERAREEGYMEALEENIQETDGLSPRDMELIQKGVRLGFEMALDVYNIQERPNQRHIQK